MYSFIIHLYSYHGVLLLRMYAMSDCVLQLFLLFLLLLFIYFFGSLDRFCLNHKAMQIKILIVIDQESSSKVRILS